MHTDRWLEMDINWFDPDAPLEPQFDLLLGRIAPLLEGVEGWHGLFFNVGWLIDIITEWRGDADQLLPMHSRRDAKWRTKSYGFLRDFLADLRASARRYDLPDLKLGLLMVGWAHVVWPPELKIYDFDSDWYGRHPELYSPPKSIIGMPDMHPINRLHADEYAYAAFPNGITEGAYFPDFFGAQWGNLVGFLNFDVLMLRDGLTGPMIYTRNGPYGTQAPADPATVAAFSDSVRDLYRALKTADPSRLIFGYSSAISPIADWRVGCVDFEAIVADGHIDGWIEQTWGGAWQDWWHQLWKGWTFQTANLLTRGAMIAAANEGRETPCRFYNLIETWDGWEPWDTLHQVPHKLRWAMWAFSHVAVQTPDGPKPPNGSYISWMNNGVGELLSKADIAYVAEHLNAATESALGLEAVHGPTLVYNRAMMEWLSANHPDLNTGEWLDDQGAMLMKWGLPVLSSSRAEWLDRLRLDMPLLGVAGQLSDDTLAALQAHDGPAVALGRADQISPDLYETLGIDQITGQQAADFVVAAAGTPDMPPYDRPYLPDHAAFTVREGTAVHYRTPEAPLITQRKGWFVWQAPDWSEPFNQFVPKYQLGSTFPHYHMARLLHQAAADADLSFLEPFERFHTIAFHLWRSAGVNYVLLGNLETGEFGDSRTARTVFFQLSRKQLGLKKELYYLQRVDDETDPLLPVVMSPKMLRFSLTLPPEQSAVYRVIERQID